MVSTVRPAGATPIHSRTAPPGARVKAPSEPGDRVTLSQPSPAAEAPSAERLLPLSSRLALAGFAALGLVGALAGTASAADAPKPPAISRSTQSEVVYLQTRPTTVQSVRTYISDMVENNRIQGETLNTYGKSFWNNWNTLQRVEQKILQNRESLNDPGVRRIYEKVKAALDSAQVFDDVEETRIYRAGGEITIETADGTRMTIPQEPFQRRFHTRQDYSGAARMTDKTIDSIEKIIQGK